MVSAMASVRRAGDREEGGQRARLQRTVSKQIDRRECRARKGRAKLALRAGQVKPGRDGPFFEVNLFIRKRMQVAHQALQALLDDMGVDLCRRDIGVAE